MKIRRKFVPVKAKRRPSLKRIIFNYNYYWFNHLIIFSKGFRVEGQGSFALV